MNARLPIAPRTRADCVDGPRPCPHRSCRHHVHHVARRGRCGAAAPADAPTCALDLADEGPRTLGEIAKVFGLTRERVRQIEAKALGKVRARLRLQGLDVGDMVEGFTTVGEIEGFTTAKP